MGVRNTCGCTVIYEEKREKQLYIRARKSKHATLRYKIRKHYITMTNPISSLQPLPARVPALPDEVPLPTSTFGILRVNSGRGGGLRRRFLPGTSRQVTVQKVANKVRALAGHASPSPPVGRSTLVRPHVRPCLPGSLLLLLLSAYFFPFCFDQGRRCGTVVFGRSPIG